MIDYFSEARISATVSVTANLCRTLGQAFSYTHREISRKIELYESGHEPDKEYAIAILKCERSEFEKWHRKLESLIAFQRDSKSEAEQNLTDNNRAKGVA